MAGAKVVNHHLTYKIIRGETHRDIRGIVRHVNQFGFENVDRFYTIAPKETGGLRGWVGHLRDWKWFFALSGKFEIGIVRPRNWRIPSVDDLISCVEVDADTPCIVEVPPGNYTASRSLVGNAVLLVFSSGKIESASTDDFRLPSNCWEIPDKTVLSGSR